VIIALGRQGIGIALSPPRPRRPLDLYLAHVILSELALNDNLISLCTDRSQHSCAATFKRPRRSVAHALF
jgi:hypothetical protein